MQLISSNFVCRFLGSARWTNNNLRSIHCTTALREVINVPPFADSVSEGDVKWVFLILIRAGYVPTTGASLMQMSRDQIFFGVVLRARRFTVKVGDEVRADENVMEIETDKTTVGVPTPVSGVIEEIYVQDGDTVKAGQKLFKLKPGAVSGKPAAKAESVAAPPPSPPAAAAPPTAKPAPKPAPAAAPRPAAAPATPPPPPPKPLAPATSVPIAAIRHAQAVEASVKVNEKLILSCVPCEWK